MRGKDDADSVELYEAGITPAYAGKSSKITTPTGESPGSPPPMRGKACSSHNA